MLHPTMHPLIAPFDLIAFLLACESVDGDEDDDVVSVVAVVIVARVPINLDAFRRPLHAFELSELKARTVRPLSLGALAAL